MDRISRRVARGRRESGLGTTGFHLCFLRMMLSCWLNQGQDLQHVLERFAAECEAAGMRISTSKSEAMVLDRKRVGVPSPGEEGAESKGEALDLPLGQSTFPPSPMVMNFGEVFQACPTGRRPRGRPRTRWRDYVSRLAWEHLGVPPEELEEVSG
ncbi:hypothetical protein L3Q82_014667, partial [Scortum barcoo]